MRHDQRQLVRSGRDPVSYTHLGHSLQQLTTLKDLGLQQKDYDLMESMIHQPYGILLFTGPTGSGKTTTLYAILNELAREEVNVITIEDPVEKRMMGINQVQVNAKAVSYTHLAFDKLVCGCELYRLYL